MGTAGLVALITFLMAAPLDPEPYHDGSQLPAAIAVSDGLVVHKDVFSGYGFITAWLQGAAVHLFGPHLLTIRIFTALTLVVVAVLMFAVTHLALRSSFLAAGVACLWVVSWPGQAVSWGTPLLPWPSVVYLVFQIGAVLCLARGLLNSRHRLVNFGAAGALAGLGVLTRLNYGVAFTLAMMITVLVFWRGSRLRPKDLAVAFLGFMAAVLIPLGIIALQGGLAAFVDQSIVGPLQGKAIVKPTEWFYLKNAYLWGSALLLVSLVVIVWAGSRKWLSTRLFTVLVALNVLGLILWTSTAVEGSPVRKLILTRLTWAPALDGQAMQALFLAAVVCGALTFLVIAAILVTLTRRAPLTPPGGRLAQRNRVLLVLLTLTSAASLTQLYPVADPNHLWWAAPLPLVLLVFVFTFSVPKRTKMAIGAVVIIPGLVMSLATAKVFWSKPRLSIETGALSGMRIAESLRPNIDKVDRLLLDVDPGSAEFICKEGLFAVWNGAFLSARPGYVDYSYNLDSADPGVHPKRTFVCSQWGDRAFIEQYARDHDMHVVRESGQVVLSYFTDIDIVEMAPNS